MMIDMRNQRGQALVLFVGGMIALLAMAALAIDLSSVYATQQTEKAAGDAAALAGGQDLQLKDTRSVDAAAQERARRDALTDLVGRFGSTIDPTTDCPTVGTVIADCVLDGTPYHVWISSPSNSHPTDQRSIQVTVKNPDYQLSFARLFGQNGWPVGQTSEAKIDYGAQYAIVTLRPTNPSKQHDLYQDDIFVKGGTIVTVVGDIGSNTNLTIDNLSQVQMGSGYKAFYLDTYQNWKSPPPGQELLEPIPDPGYPIPNPPTAHGGQDMSSACGQYIQDATKAGYLGYSKTQSNTIQTYDLTTANTTCWSPGLYTSTEAKAITAASTNTTTVLLEPGLFYFQYLFSPGGTVIGGWNAGQEGVAVAIDASYTTFAGNNATLIALNAGSCFTSSKPATCTDWAAPVPGLSVSFKTKSGTISVPESFIVVPTQTQLTYCHVDTTTTVANTQCPSNSGPGALNLPGGGSLFVAGVQYGPADNVQISGGSAGAGYVGQIIAYTLQYTGGSQIGQVYPGGPGNGVLRLTDTCSGPATPCTAP